MSNAAALQLPGGHRVGDQLPEVTLDVTYTTVATLVAGTWDVFPGHHDPSYAADQGQRDIYLNTMVLAGFLDRVVLDWAGPTALIRRRSMRMGQSVYPGDRLVGRARVRDADKSTGTGLDVEVDVECGTDAGICLTGVVCVRIPDGSGGTSTGPA